MVAGSGPSGVTVADPLYQCTTLPLVTVTAHLNEHHGAPPGGFNAAWAQDTCLPFWCTKYILYVHIIYLEVTKSGRLKKIKNFYIQ